MYAVTTCDIIASIRLIRSQFEKIDRSVVGDERLQHYASTNANYSRAAYERFGY